MNISKPALVALLVVVLLIGAAGAYAISTATQNNKAQEDPISSTEQHPTEDTTDPTDPTAPTTTDDQAEGQIVNGVNIPLRVVDQIKQDYPDYVIDDADREVDGGVVHYEIELEHQDTANDSEHELRYDKDWNFVSVKSDD